VTVAKILIVDDKPLNRSVLTTLLGYHGHQLFEAGSGSEALEQVQREAPELVITDILMPAMDGYEFVRRLRDLQGIRQPKVIFNSATYLADEAQALARACGVSSVLGKPAEPEEMLRVVDNALGHTSEVIVNSTNTGVVDEAVKVLSNKLYQKIQEIEELNVLLERRVAERTAELDRANRSLQEHIVERRNAEEEATKIREEQLRTKSEFLSHVSHELRSPLAVVHQFTTILLDELAGPLAGEQRNYLEIPLRNLNQLKAMIDDLLEASRADLGKLAIRRSSMFVGDVIATVERSQQAAANRKDIRLESQIADDLPSVYGDASRIFQVLTNLVDNAIKFSPARCAITVRARIFEQDRSFVRISVSDCGCGIKPEDAGRVFDRLFQVCSGEQPSRQGLGLGLYICKEIVQQHGGTIWVDPEGRAGTTIHFTLPVFNVSGLVAPLIIQDGRLAANLVLLTVKVLPLGSGVSERDRERAQHTVQQVLERCSLPDLDVLLPPEQHGRSIVFAVVARTDERGAQVMVARIREQLSRQDELTKVGFQCAVDSEVIELASLVKGLPLDGCAARVGRYLQRQLTNKKNGEKPNGR
jgi:signal transduction histidine kinase